MERIKGILLKTGATLLTIIVCLFPVELYLSLDSILSPTGFWQNIITMGIGLYFLFGLQIFLLIIMIKVILIIWE